MTVNFSLREIKGVKYTVMTGKPVKYIEYLMAMQELVLASNGIPVNLLLLLLAVGKEWLNYGNDYQSINHPFIIALSVCYYNNRNVDKERQNGCHTLRGSTRCNSYRKA